MGTHNFTDIAKSVAKSAYTYVVCNTYIHRVYIKMLGASSTVLPTTIRAPAEAGIRKHESNFSESKSMNKISHKCLD